MSELIRKQAFVALGYRDVYFHGAIATPLAPPIAATFNEDGSPHSYRLEYAEVDASETVEKAGGARVELCVMSGQT